MEEEIDYKSVVNQLQHENERLRKQAMEKVVLRKKIDFKHINTLLYENYFIIVVGFIVLSCIFEGIEVIQNGRRA